MRAALGAILIVVVCARAAVDESRVTRYPGRVEMVRDLVGPGAVGCEIGVFEGNFSEVLRSLLPSRLYLVDVFQGLTGSGDVDGNDYREVDLPKKYLELVQRYAGASDVVFVRDLSHLFLASLPDEHLDFIYIDGDHSYAGVLRDLAAAYPKVKRGGLIMGHDYSVNWDKATTDWGGGLAGVAQALEVFLSEKGLRLDAVAMDGMTSFAVRKGSPSSPFLGPRVGEGGGLGEAQARFVAYKSAGRAAAAWLRGCVAASLRAEAASLPATAAWLCGRFVDRTRGAV